MADWSESLDAALKASLSGAGWAAPFGVAHKLWTGGRSPAAILRAAAAAGLLGGGVAGGSVLAGSTVMGDPEPGESNPYTKRAGVGGALAGGGIGAALGALAAAGRWPKSLPAALTRFLPKANIITDKIMKWGDTPGNWKKGAALGGAAVGLPATLYAADEGMGLDVLNQELQKERIRKALMGEYE